ncbi:MAG: transposase [Candidatus Zixiibacteriota bacterium]
MRKNRDVLSWVVTSYHTRWRVEETIRFIKQSYALEDVRVLTYRRLQNMMALVLAVSYFTMAYLGRRIKLKAISGLLLRVSKRIFGIPDFRFYALSDGIRELLRRNDKGPLRNLPNQLHKYQLSLFNP